ncbi:MAG: hypothetical protein MUP47_11680, partial [Phycisphaerae bacterium]|nr:hypothetical protein [Phycisphaerae bacterium]
MTSRGPAAEGVYRPSDAWKPLAELRQSIGRFAHTYAALPVDTQATCPTCQRVVPARFGRAGRQI